jgi:CRP-like cAMP-binding protein
MITATNASTRTASNRRNAPMSAPAEARLNNKLIHGLSPKIYSDIRSRMRPVFLKKGKVLSFEGTEPEYVYFPENAVVSEYQCLEDGRMVETNMTGHDGALGLFEAFCDSKSSKYAQVTQSGAAYQIPARELKSLTRSCDELRKMSERHVNEFTRHLAQQSICMMFHSTRERFATWLLSLFDRCRTDSVSVTQEEMARCLGVYRPTVSVLSMEFRDAGLISGTRGNVSLVEREGLKREACECYTKVDNPWKRVA